MHLWGFSNFKNDDFPHVFKVYMEPIVFFCGGECSYWLQLSIGRNKKRFRISQAPKDDLGEPFPGLDNFVDSLTINTSNVKNIYEVDLGDFQTLNGSL